MVRGKDGSSSGAAPQSWTRPQLDFMGVQAVFPSFQYLRNDEIFLVSNDFQHHPELISLWLLQLSAIKTKQQLIAWSLCLRPLQCLTDVVFHTNASKAAGEEKVDTGSCTAYG